ncbi:MAG: hypothetical protein E7288_04415 [Lachnospiraceae bacterium]|nr:hypothetical protein [Lachnospiraceae bacterium]
MKREMLIHKKEEISMEIDKYKKIGKWNTIGSGIAILLNIIAFVISFAIVMIIGQIENVYEIPQKIEEIIGGGGVLLLFNSYIAIQICICMVICSFLAFVIFGIGCVIAKKKPEKLFGFAIAQSFFWVMNQISLIVQCGVLIFFVFAEMFLLGKFLFGGEGLLVELAYACFVAGINLPGWCCYSIADLLVSITFLKCLLMLFGDRPESLKRKNNSIETIQVL